MSMANNREALVEIEDYIESTYYGNDYGEGCVYDFESAHDDEFRYIDTVIELANSVVIVSDEPGAELLHRLANTNGDAVDITEGNWLADVSDDIRGILCEK
jgi:hypothetical protein